MNFNTNFKPNILFILIDGMRTDKFYGINKSSMTPNIDLLVRKGVYFNQTISSADGTFLSLNCIFNSIYPFRTGTRAKKIILTEHNLLATLKNFGYHIYGFVPDLISLRPLAKFCENNDVSYQGTPPVEHLSDGLGNKILEKLSKDKITEPWFFYVHILDLHHPHVVSEQFRDKKYGSNSYEKIVSEIDYWLGKILNKINIQKTLIIVTADHGLTIPIDNKTTTDFEPNLTLGVKIGKHVMPKSTHAVAIKLLLGLRHLVRDIRLAKANRNLNSFEKRSRLPYFTLSLYDEAIRVPLLFAGLNIPSKIISQQTRTIDIFTTLMDIINIKPKNNVFDGISLLPLIQDEPLEELPVYLHTMPYEQILPDDKVGIRTSHYKYFRSAHNQKENIYLYDLVSDPMENFNIANTQSNLVTEMEKILTQILAKSQKAEYKENEEEIKKIQQELRKLGYL